MLAPMNHNSPRPVPRLGVSVMLVDSDRVLLVRRGKDPFRGRWSLPGGSVEFGERLHEAALRELAEETGLRAEIEPQPAELVEAIAVGEQGAGPGHHFVIAVFRASAPDGLPRAGDDAEDAAFFDLAALDGLEMTPGTAARIRRLSGIGT